MNVLTSLLGIMRIGVKIAFVMSAVFAFIIVLLLTTSAIGTVANQGVLSDVIAIVQMWLPFNLTPMMAWLLTASVAYLWYRLTLAGLFFIHRAIDGAE
jgi:O-antigen ligase